MNPAKPGKLGSWTQLTWVTCSLGSHGLAGFWTQLKPRFNLGWTQLSVPGFKRESTIPLSSCKVSKPDISSFYGYKTVVMWKEYNGCYLNILIWAINFVIESITRSFIMLNTLMENKNTNFANILIPFLRPCSQHWFQEKNRNISKICVFIFHHSIQDDEASGYVFYNGCYIYNKKKLQCL